MNAPGIPVFYNGREFTWTSLAIDERAGSAPTFIVTVEGSKGHGHTIDNALLFAARDAESTLTHREGS